MKKDFSRKTENKIEIPTSSMPDIIFMLLIFFMVTTVMKTHQGLQVKVPEAKKAKKIETAKRNIVSLWINKGGEIVCNDFRVKHLPELKSFVQGLMYKNQKSKIVIKMDQDAKMGKLSDVQQELRKARALSVFYASRIKR